MFQVMRLRHTSYLDVCFPSVVFSAGTERMSLLQSSRKSRLAMGMSLAAAPMLRDYVNIHIRLVSYAPMRDHGLDVRRIFSVSNFTIGFYIAGNDPPTPAVDQVFVKELGSKNVYVREVRHGLSAPEHIFCRMTSLVAPLQTT